MNRRPEVWGLWREHRKVSRGNLKYTGRQGFFEDRFLLATWQVGSDTAQGLDALHPRDNRQEARVPAVLPQLASPRSSRSLALPGGRQRLVEEGPPLSRWPPGG